MGTGLRRRNLPCWWRCRSILAATVLCCSALATIWQVAEPGSAQARDGGQEKFEEIFGAEQGVSLLWTRGELSNQDVAAAISSLKGLERFFQSISENGLGYPAAQTWGSLHEDYHDISSRLAKLQDGGQIAIGESQPGTAGAGGKTIFLDATLDGRWNAERVRSARRLGSDDWGHLSQLSSALIEKLALSQDWVQWGWVDKQARRSGFELGSRAFSGISDAGLANLIRYWHIKDRYLWASAREKSAPTIERQELWAQRRISLLYDGARVLRDLGAAVSSSAARTLGGDWQTFKTQVATVPLPGSGARVSDLNLAGAGLPVPLPKPIVAPPPLSKPNVAGENISEEFVAEGRDTLPVSPGYDGESAVPFETEARPDAHTATLPSSASATETGTEEDAGKESTFARLADNGAKNRKGNRPTSDVGNLGDVTTPETEAQTFPPAPEATRTSPLAGDSVPEHGDKRGFPDDSSVSASAEEGAVSPQAASSPVLVIRGTGASSEPRVAGVDIELTEDRSPTTEEAAKPTPSNTTPALPEQVVTQSGKSGGLASQLGIQERQLVGVIAAILLSIIILAVALLSARRRLPSQLPSGEHEAASEQADLPTEFEKRPSEPVFSVPRQASDGRSSKVIPLDAYNRSNTTAARRAESERLARVPDAPHERILAFANDDNIEIARSVLRYSPVLRDQDLVGIIRRRSPNHRLAVAERRTLSNGVADALVESGDTESIVILLENHKAPISESRLEDLVDASRYITRYQNLLAERPDLTSNLARRLYSMVGPNLRAKLQKHIKPNLGETATHGKKGGAARPDQTIRHRVLVEALQHGNVERFETLFARMLGMASNRIDGVLYGPRCEAFAIACRALGMERMIFTSIFALIGKHRADRLHSETHDLATALETFDRLTQEEAETVLASWRRSAGRRGSGDSEEQVAG